LDFYQIFQKLIKYYINVCRKYYSAAVTSERRSTLRSAQAYRNNGLELGETPDVAKSPRSRTPKARGRRPELSRNLSENHYSPTRRLQSDIDHINQGFERMNAVAEGILNTSNERATNLR
jgi:hypothetical protein